MDRPSINPWASSGAGLAKQVSNTFFVQLSSPAFGPPQIFFESGRCPDNGAHRSDICGTGFHNIPVSCFRRNPSFRCRRQNSPPSTLLVSVFLPQICHWRNAFKGHIFYPFGHFLYGSASDVAVDIGFAAQLAAQLKKIRAYRSCCPRQHRPSAC